VDRTRRTVLEETSAKMKRALETPLTVVVCGPTGSKSYGRLREAVRRSLKTDRVIFLEELIGSREGQEAIGLIEETLLRSLELDRKEILILKTNAIDKNVHIVEGPGAIAELVRFEIENDIFKKMYAFVDERFRDAPGYLNQGVYVRLLRDNRLFWFKNEADLKSKVSSALSRNRISKSGILGAGTI
jgi:hypothetical protein